MTDPPSKEFIDHFRIDQLKMADAEK